MTKKFNPAQREAICHKDGPAMILAGPGSGKTTVITRRVRYLIEDEGVHPASILVVTFTKAAAVEMKARFFSLCGNISMPVSFGTFHSIFFSILKTAYNYNAADIITDSRRMELFREIVDELELETDDTADFISNVAGEVSLVKGENMDLSNYYSANCAEDVFRKIYSAYNRKLRQSRLIDFDDMLVFTYELFMERPDILCAWQKKFRYILIDEFQDINRLQYEIIKMLAAPENNLFIVGDDDQSIYRFRGARPEIMLGFTGDFPAAKTVILDINYRCTQEIVEAALRVIKNNRERYEKKLRAAKLGGNPVDIKMFNDMGEEYDTLIKAVYQYHRRDGLPLRHIAVLYRTNTGARRLLARLMEYNVPFRMKDTLPNLFEHWIARDFLAYINIARGKGGRSDYLRIINRPKRYISRQMLSILGPNAPGHSFEDGRGFEAALSSLKAQYTGKDWAGERIDKLMYDLQSIRDMTPYGALNYIRYGIGYDSFLVEYARERRLKEEELLDVASDVMESAKNFQSYQDWFDYIEDYGRRLAMQSKKQREDDGSDGIILSTMHSAKGLEYEVVFIIDANEGVAPHKKAVMEADVEEERRMFYVAMTRAKSFLHIYFTKERYKKPVNMSRFVGELLVDREQFAKGTRVRHKTYGEGTITKVTQTAVSILFRDTKEMKTLNLSFCISNHLLEIIEANTAVYGVPVNCNRQTLDKD